MSVHQFPTATPDKPSRVDLFDAAGHYLGAVLMARTPAVVGAGAETVYLNRNVEPERVRQTA